MGWNQEVVLLRLMGLLALYCYAIDAKVFEQCELARLLKDKHRFPLEEVAKWVCIAKHQSNLNSGLRTGPPGSGSHGLFQISDQFWCSSPGKDGACDIPCDRLRDDDLTDDIECISRIYDEHERISGNGYSAWTTYERFCKDRARKSIDGCFESTSPKRALSNFDTFANSIIPAENKVKSKIYSPCELAKELRYKHQIPSDQIDTWVCIAKHESKFNTSAIGRLNADGSGDHGLFQISDIYWCSPPGQGWACGLSCDELEDSDITDDVECIKRIYEEHNRISGDGFNAWAVYQPYCKSRTQSYIEGCFNDIGTTTNKPTSSFGLSTFKPEWNFDLKPKKPGKVYTPCELAKELRHKYKIPMEQIATWVCIAKHESNFNTSAIGRLNVDGSGDHGIFQISDIYWCSPPGNGWACGLSCSDLEDADITNDVDCIKKIHEEHTRLSGDGFNAWAVYKPYCKDRSDRYIQGCFSDVKPDYFSTDPPKINTYGVTVSKGKGKVYKPCELANDLRYKYNVPKDQIATWVCIAKHESNFNTSAIGRLNGDESEDHGLFQISDIYWCSHPGKGWACGLSCDELEDADISNDVDCIRKIYEEHQRLSGDGFNAWTVYKPHCKGRSESYVAGCFDDFESNTISVQPYVPDRGSHRSSSKSRIGRGKVYSSCELAKELRYKHHIPLDQIDTWVCIAKHESNFNTSAIGRLNADGSGDHGLFQISDIYWCSPPGKGWACGLSCGDLEDSDITDDVECIKKIHEEHTRLSGDGFNAWAVYKPYCESRTKSYIGGCFDDYSGTETNALIPVAETKYAFKGPSKTYTRCELAEELRRKHRLPESQIATWVCIAEHESNLNTGAMNAGSGDHGLFQISELFWCDKERPGKECRVECGKFRDNDITDDVECIKKIYKEHSRLSGDGFNAWVVYPQRCKGRAEEYIRGCSQSSTLPPQTTDRPPLIVPAITAPTNLLDYREQFSKRLGSTKAPFSSVKFSDFFKKSSFDTNSQFFENPPTTKSSLYSVKFGEFFDNSKVFGTSDDSVLPTPSSQTFDDTFFPSKRPFDLLTTKIQPDFSKQFGVSSINTQPESTLSRLGTGAGSRFSLSSLSSSFPDFTTTRKPPATISDDSRTTTDSVFNFGQRPIILTIKDKTTTKPPTKGTTSREDRFAGFAAFDATSRFSTTKTTFTSTPTKSVFLTTSDPFGSKGGFGQQSFGQFDTTTTTSRPFKKEPSKIFVPTSTTDPDVDIFGFYFDLYNLKRKPDSTTRYQSSEAVFPTSTKAPLLLQNPETSRIGQNSAFSSSTTSTVRPFASSEFSATPEFRGVRFGSLYDGRRDQLGRIASSTRSSTVFENRNTSERTKKPDIFEQGFGISKSKPFKEAAITTTTRSSRFNDFTTQTPYRSRGKPLSGFRFGSAIASESGNSKSGSNRKQTDSSSSGSSTLNFGSFSTSATQHTATSTTRKPFGIVGFGVSSAKPRFDTEVTTSRSSGFSSRFDESNAKLGTKTNRPGKIFDDIFDGFVH